MNTGTHSGGRVESALGAYADDLREAELQSDDPAKADAYAVLAAMAAGDDPPSDAARRIKQRASGDRR